MSGEGKKIFYFASAIFTGIFILHFILILILNNEQFTYAIDDPYIHLSLAENIAEGHYGININEPSSPSSSIIFPFILTAFTFFMDAEFIPLILNFFFAIGFIFVAVKILQLLFPGSSKKEFLLRLSILLIVLIPAANLFGLVYTGMEHVLQLLLAVIIIYMVIKFILKDKISYLIIIPLVLLPLVRYEGLAVTVPVLLYLFYFKKWKIPLIASVISALVLLLFTLFLTNLDLSPLPASILVKSGSVSGSSILTTVFANFKTNLREPFLMLLAIQIPLFISYAVLTKNVLKYKLFAPVIASSILLHLLFGSSVWFYRYEIYIWLVSILSLTFLFNSYILKFVSNLSTGKIILVLFLFSTIIFYRNYHITFAVPFASNNIYLQQFQMRKLLTEYYKQPVAVNDIGYVSYKNDIYILDLWGLSNYKASEKRFTANGLSEMVSDNDINLVMVYKKEFGQIPGDWIELGVLELEVDRVSAASENVNFFVTDPVHLSEIRNKTKEWEKTLPKGVKFHFYSE